MRFLPCSLHCDASYMTAWFGDVFDLSHAPENEEKNLILGRVLSGFYHAFLTQLHRVCGAETTANASFAQVKVGKKQITDLTQILASLEKEKSNTLNLVDAFVNGGFEQLAESAREFYAKTCLNFSKAIEIAGLKA